MVPMSFSSVGRRSRGIEAIGLPSIRGHPRTIYGHVNLLQRGAETTPVRWRQALRRGNVLREFPGKKEGDEEPRTGRVTREGRPRHIRERVSNTCVGTTLRLAPQRGMLSRHET